MTTKEKTFKTIPVGTKVTWHYRSAIGHGTVTAFSKLRAWRAQPLAGGVKPHARVSALPVWCTMSGSPGW